MENFENLFGVINIGDLFADDGEIKPESPKMMFKRYSESLRNALSFADRRIENLEIALKAFKCAATHQDIPVLPERLGIVEDGLTVEEMLSKMESYLNLHLFDELGGITEETPDREDWTNMDALKASVANYEERAKKAESEVEALKKELQASNDAEKLASQRAEAAEAKLDKLTKAEPLTGEISEIFRDAQKWGGLFKDIAGLLTTEDIPDGKPVTEYEAALSVLRSGVSSNADFNALGGFVNAEYVCELKAAMLSIVSSRGKMAYCYTLYNVEPTFIRVWKSALSYVRAFAALQNQTEILESTDISLYGRLRDIYAQSNELQKFKPEIVQRNFEGKINGFIQNLQTAADSPEPEDNPEAESTGQKNPDDDLPFEFHDDISEAVQRENDIIRAGLEAYKANPSAWKEIIDDRRKAMGVTAEQYPDGDAVTDILREKPYLRPENYKTETENIPPFDGFEADSLLALPASQDENWLEKFFKNWVDKDGERFKERVKLMFDVFPVLREDEIIGKLFDTRNLEATERFPVALACCGGVLRYQDAQNMLKYKDTDTEWGKAYRKLVGALAVSCCIQMTKLDGVGNEKRVYDFGKVGEQAGVPAWVNDAMQEALAVKGYSTALLSLKLENRQAAKTVAESKPEEKTANADGYYYDSVNECYVIIRKGDTIDDSLEQVSEDVYERGSEYNIPPVYAQNIINACRLWKIVPSEVSWEKACHPDYYDEWSAEIRRYLETNDTGNNPTILQLLDDEKNRHVPIQQFQMAYRNGNMSLERVWKFLLGENFDAIAPWEPDETADLNETCREAAKYWNKFTEK